jgi:hypothetical protein
LLPPVATGSNASPAPAPAPMPPVQDAPRRTGEGTEIIIRPFAPASGAAPPAGGN